MKVQISINDELMERVDDFAKKNYINRSSLFTIAVLQYINTQDVTKAIKDMAICMQKIADNADKGKVTEEMLQELEDFNRIAQMLYYSDPRNIQK